VIMQWARHFEIWIHNSYNSVFYDFKYCIAWWRIPERKYITLLYSKLEISVDTNMELSCLFDYFVGGYIETNILVHKIGRIPEILLICCNARTNVYNQSGRKTNSFCYKLFLTHTISTTFCNMDPSYLQYQYFMTIYCTALWWLH
jgi:hypothetical protein